MSMLAPYAGTSLERLIALMNSVNKTNYQIGIHFNFGKMYDVFPSDRYNTRIKIIPVDTATYSEQYFFYRRLPISVLEKLPPGFITPVELNIFPFTIHQLLPNINLALGLDLTPDEVYDDAFTDLRSTYPLRIKPNASMAWTTSTYFFSVTQLRGRFRALEDGSLRMTESGTVRGLETY